MYDFMRNYDSLLDRADQERTRRKEEGTPEERTEDAALREKYSTEIRLCFSIADLKWGK